MSNILAGFFGAVPSAPDGQGSAGDLSAEGILAGATVSAHSGESEGKGFEGLLEEGAPAMLPEESVQTEEEGKPLVLRSGSESLCRDKESRALASDSRVIRAPFLTQEASRVQPPLVLSETSEQVSADPLVELEGSSSEGEQMGVSLKGSRAESASALIDSGRPIVAEARTLAQIQPKEAVSSIRENEEITIAPVRPVRPLDSDDVAPVAKGRLLEFVRDVLGSEEPEAPLGELAAARPKPKTSDAESYESQPLMLELKGEEGVAGKAFSSPVLSSDSDQGSILDQNVVHSIVRGQNSAKEDSTVILSASENANADSFVLHSNSKDASEGFKYSTVFSKNQDLGSSLTSSLETGAETYGDKATPQGGVLLMPEGGRVSQWIESSLSLGVYEDTETALKNQEFNPLIMRTAVHASQEEGGAQPYVSGILEALATSGRTVSAEVYLLNQGDSNAGDLIGAPSLFRDAVSQDDRYALEGENDARLRVSDDLGALKLSEKNVVSEVVLHAQSSPASVAPAVLASLANDSDSSFSVRSEIEELVTASMPLESRSIASVDTLSFSEKTPTRGLKDSALPDLEESGSVEGITLPYSADTFSRPVKAPTTSLNKGETLVLSEGKSLSVRSLSESKGLPLVCLTRGDMTTAKETPAAAKEGVPSDLEVLGSDNATRTSVTATKVTDNSKGEEPSASPASPRGYASFSAPKVSSSENEASPQEAYELPLLSQALGTSAERKTDVTISQQAPSNSGIKSTDLSGKSIPVNQSGAVFRSPETEASPQEAYELPLVSQALETSAERKTDATISQQAPSSSGIKSTDLSDKGIPVNQSGAVFRSPETEALAPRQAAELNRSVPLEEEVGTSDSSFALPESIDKGANKEGSAVYPEARSLTGSAHSKESTPLGTEPATVQQPESASASAKKGAKTYKADRAEEGLLPKLGVKPQSVESGQVSSGQQALLGVQEGVKDSPKPLLDRVLNGGEIPGLSPQYSSEAVEGEGNVDFVAKAGMPIAQQPPRMHSRSHRTLEQAGAPTTSLESHISSAPISGYVQKETNTAPFSQAPSEDVPHLPLSAEEDAKDSSAQNKDLMPVTQRLQQSTTPQSIESFSQKMRSEPLPSVPDLNPKLLRQLEQFQRSQRPWAKISLPMGEGEDLMLRMKVSSGHVQIRFGTQSAPLRDGLERGWSELVNQAASRGIQLDSPEFEARLKTRALGLEGTIFAESSDEGEKPLKSFKRKSANTGQSIDSNEPLDDYPGVLKWA